MAEKEVVLLETVPQKRLMSLLPKLVNPETGQYNFPAHSFFEGVEKVHQAGFRGSGEIVAVIDTGIDHTHPLLKEAVVDARDFTGEGTTQDLHGHGTMVSLLIRYVAPQAKLLNAKALAQSGKGEPSALAAAMDWAIQGRATVVNISAGVEAEDPLSAYPGFLRRYFAKKLRTYWPLFFLRSHLSERCPVCEAAGRVLRSGTMVCAAVGNRKGTVYCPSRGNKKALSVGTARTNGPATTVPGYSGHWPDLVAPEVSLAEGTSFSAPFVTGGYSLLHEAIETKDKPVNLARLGHITARGDFLFDKGHFHDAMGLYLRALARDAHGKKHDSGKKKLENCNYCKLYTYPVRMRLGLAYLQTGQSPLAEKQFELNVRIAPDFPGAHMNLGAAYREQGRLHDAEQEYLIALSLGGGPEAYEGLGDTADLMGNQDRAIDAFERSIGLDPSRCYSYRRLITLYRQKGLLDQAQICSERLVEFNCPDA